MQAVDPLLQRGGVGEEVDCEGGRVCFCSRKGEGAGYRCLRRGEGGAGGQEDGLDAEGGEGVVRPGGCGWVRLRLGLGLWLVL